MTCLRWEGPSVNKFEECNRITIFLILLSVWFKSFEPPVLRFHFLRFHLRFDSILILIVPSLSCSLKLRVWASEQFDAIPMPFGCHSDASKKFAESLDNCDPSDSCDWGHKASHCPLVRAPTAKSDDSEVLNRLRFLNLSKSLRRPMLGPFDRNVLNHNDDHNDNQIERISPNKT